MAEDPKTVEPLADAAETASSAEGRKLGLVTVIIIVAVVSLLEGGVFFLLAGSGNAAAQTDDEDAALASDVVESSLGKFITTNGQANPGSGITITVEIAALVSQKQQVQFEDAASKSHKERIRAAVVQVLRSASLQDLNDPRHSTLRRLIREEINKVIRKSIVNEIVISNFSTFEQ